MSGTSAEPPSEVSGPAGGGLAARTPWPAPAAVTLRGERVTLVPLEPAAHAEPLFEAAQGAGAETDAALWEHLPYGPFADVADLQDGLRAIAADPDVVAFAVLDGDVPSGVVAYLRLRPAHGSVEIGHVWFGGRVQRTTVGTEAIGLLQRHAFDDLGYRRVEWKCDAANARSRSAAVRLGFVHEGTFRQDMVVKGRNRDTAWFALLDRDWPPARAALDAWLDAARTGAPPALAALRARPDAGQPGSSP